jgi:hypothetical protein
MGEITQRYEKEVYDILAKAAIDAQKPLGEMYIRIPSGGFIGPSNKAISTLNDLGKVEKVIVGANSTVLVGGNKDINKVKGNALMTHR